MHVPAPDCFDFYELACNTCWLSRELDLDESDQEEPEEQDVPSIVKETPPMYLNPRAPSIKDDEDGDLDDVPLSAEYLRTKMANR